MALQPKKPGTGKPVKGAPVTAHPLFPAVVALWFGALFGLGSLAIRVGLLESLVLATRIDTVIPAAGPPLGMSARILLALTLAALGALLGAYIARKIATPKAVVRERKRKPVLSADESVSLRSRDAHPDAPARRPLSVHDEVDQQGAEFAPAADLAEPATNEPLAGRRRSALAIEHDAPFELHELAPLPGGGSPQILMHGAAYDTPLELDSFEAAEELPPLAQAPALDWHAAAAQPTIGEAAKHASNDRHLDSAPDFSPPEDVMPGRQIFGMSQRQPDEVLDELGITDAEFEALPSADADRPDDGTALTGLEDRHDFARTEAWPDSLPVSPVVPTTEREADPSKLPMTALAQRLAESMQRRRDRVSQSAAIVPAKSLAAEAVHDAEPVHDLATTGFAPASLPHGIPQASFAHPNDIPLPPLADVGTQPGIVAPEPPATDPVHAVAAPEVQPAPAQDFAADLALPGTAAPAVPVLPAALRPLVLDPLTEDDEDEDGNLAGFLPPRSFPRMEAVARSAIPEPFAPEADAASLAEAAPLSSSAAAEAVDDADETKFGSLLAHSRPAETRQTFVRIEDEPASVAQIEPVVIFPGQLARSHASAGESAMGAGAGQPAEPGASFRQFDTPGSADVGQAVAPAATSEHDPAATEHALRAALANLQRMSGAA